MRAWPVSLGLLFLAGLLADCKSQPVGGSTAGSLGIDVSPDFAAILADPTDPRYAAFADAYRTQIAEALGVSKDDVEISLPPPPPPAGATGGGPAAQSVGSHIDFNVDQSYGQALGDPESPEYKKFEEALKVNLAEQLGVEPSQIEIDPSTLQAMAAVDTTTAQQSVSHDMSIEMSPEYAAMMQDPTDPQYAATRLALKEKIAASLGVDPSLVSIDASVDPPGPPPPAGAGARSTNGELNFNIDEAYAQALRDPSSAAYAQFTQSLRESIADQLSTPGHKVRPPLSLCPSLPARPATRCVI
jgi:2C-methyl-D-erythritol 2,4-cyclodiphosphate synthase